MPNDPVAQARADLLSMLAQHKPRWSVIAEHVPTAVALDALIAAAEARGAAKGIDLERLCRAFHQPILGASLAPGGWDGSWEGMTDAQREKCREEMAEVLRHYAEAP